MIEMVLIYIFNLLIFDSLLSICTISLKGFGYNKKYHKSLQNDLKVRIISNYRGIIPTKSSLYTPTHHIQNDTGPATQ